MAKTPSRISEPLSRRLSFAFFSMLRQLRGSSAKSLPTVEPQTAMEVAEYIHPSQMVRKENFFFRIIGFFYLYILAAFKYFSALFNKIIVAIFSPVRKIASFLFEIILDLSEWIYMTVLVPFYDRYSHFFQGIMMVLKSKLFTSGLLITATVFLSRTLLTTSPRHAVVYALVPVFSLVVFLYPIFGLCCYLWFGLGMLHEMFWNVPVLFFGSPLIFAGMASYLLRIIIGKEREFSWVHDNQNLIIMVIWSILILGSIMSGSIRARIHNYLTFTVWFAVYFLAIQIVGSKKHRLMIFLYCLCSIYIIFSYKVIRQAFYFGTETTHTITAGVGGRMGDNNELAACLLMMFPILIAVTQISKNKLVKNVFMLSCVMSIAAIIYTNSRGSLIGFSVIILPTIFKLILKNRKIRKRGIIIIIVVAIAGASFFHKKVGDRFGTIQNWKTDPSATNRIICVVAGINMMKDKPLFGVGSGALQYYFDSYCPDSLTLRYWFGKEGTVFLTKPSRSGGVAIHNAYAALGGGEGIFVLFLWVFLLFYSIWKLRNLRIKLPKTAENEWAHILSHGLELSIISYLVTAMFLNNYAEGLLYMILAVSISLQHISLRRKVPLDIASALWTVLLIFPWVAYTFALQYHLVE